jgi:hypothetical protein
MPENEIPACEIHPQKESLLLVEEQHYEMKEEACAEPKSVDRIQEGDTPQMEDETIGEINDANKGLKEDEEPKDLNKDLEEDELSEGEIMDPIEDSSPFNAQ